MIYIHTCKDWRCWRLSWYHARWSLLWIVVMQLLDIVLYIMPLMIGIVSWVLSLRWSKVLWRNVRRPRDSANTDGGLYPQQCAYRSWKVIELGLGYRMSLKIMVAAFFWAIVVIFGFYVRYLNRNNSAQLTEFIYKCRLKHANNTQKMIMWAYVYDSLTCLISNPLNSTGKTWKMNINGHGKSYKMHVNRSWIVMENQFHYSVRTVKLSKLAFFLLNL